MEVSKKYFPKIVLDNDNVFLEHLKGIIESTDEFAKMEISKTPEALHFRIVTSLPKYTIPLLEEILKFCNFYKIRLDLSKSIKSSGTLSFNLITKYE